MRPAANTYLRGFAAYLTDDEPPELAFYCSKCAEREFRDSDRSQATLCRKWGRLGRHPRPTKAARPLNRIDAAQDQDLHIVPPGLLGQVLYD